MTKFLLLLLLAPMALAGEVTFPIGVWYEGGVGAFRYNTVPEDPAAAASMYKKDFADIAAHGLNAAVVPNTQPDHHKALLDAAQANKIRLIVELDREGGELGQMVRGSMPLTDEAVQKALDAKLKPIMSHPALLGVQLLDEPWPDSFKRYEQIASAIKAYAPDLLPFTCLPGLGGFTQFLETVKPQVVAYDDYPIRTGAPVTEEVMTAFEQRMNTACLEAAKHHTPVWAVLQAHAIDGFHPYPTPAQIRCMTYLALASGCKGIWWFLYQSEYFSTEPKRMMYGLVDENHKGDERWREVGLLAREIRKLAPTLLNLTISDAKVESNCVAHVLNDRSGRIYVSAVNTDTLSRRSISLQLDSKGKVLRLPERKVINSSIRDGKLTWSDNLDPGAGAFYQIK